MILARGCNESSAGIACLLTGLERILQADGAVEHQMIFGRILAVGTEVAQTHELVGSGSFGIAQAGLHLTAGEDFQRVGVHASKEILASGIWIGIVKQVAVLTNLSIGTVAGIHPVNGSAFDFPAVSRITATGFGIVGCQHFHHIAVFVGNAAGAPDEVSTFQAALGAIGIQALVLGDRSGQEVVSLDPQLPASTQ